MTYIRKLNASVIDGLTFSKSAGFIERLAAKAAATACSIVIIDWGGDEIEWRLNEVGGIDMAIERVVIIRFLLLRLSESTAAIL
jgi:hypothetical protein